MYESKPNWEGVTVTGLEGVKRGVGDCGQPWSDPTGPPDAGPGSAPTGGIDLSNLWGWFMSNPWAWLVVGVVVYAAMNNEPDEGEGKKKQ